MAIEQVPRGIFHTQVNWLVRVFGLSGLIYRPYDRMSAHTIALFGCMYIRSHYREASGSSVFLNLSGPWQIPAGSDGRG